MVKCQFALLVFLLAALSDESVQNPSVFPFRPQQQQACGAQVQICAPLSNLPGQEANLEGLRGQKGERGQAGKAGPPGDITPLNVSGIENEMTSLKAQIKSIQGLRNTVCPSLTFTFPRKRQILDYVWYRGYVPSLKAATACAWIVTEVSHEFSVFSYAIASSSNEFLFLVNAITFFPWVRGSSLSSFTQNSTSVGIERHVCMWFDTESNQIGFSVNGKSLGTKSYTGGAIRSNGSFLLGQEQDSKNAGGLDPDQSFTGTIGNFFMWPRVLTSSEIRAVAQDCICPVDYVIAPSMQNVELFGDVTYDVPEVCPIV